MLILLFTNGFARSEQSGTPEPVDYDLEVKVDYDSSRIYGKCSITLKNPTDRPITEIPILLYRLLEIRSVQAGDGTELPFEQKVVPLEGWDEIKVNHAAIELREPLKPREERLVNMEYDGSLQGYAGEGWGYVKDHVDREFTMIRQDGFGYPVVCHPEISKMKLFISRGYAYRLKIDVPEDLVVANGGELVDKKAANGRKTYVYKNLLPAWRMDIAVGKYAEMECGSYGIFYFPEDSAGAQSVGKAMGDALELYGNWFGALKEKHRLSVIEIPVGYGSQKDRTAILQTADSFRDPERLHEVYHELAHLWNVTPLDSMPCRLESEGFATFLECLLQEKLEGRTNAVKLAVERHRKRFRTESERNPGLLSVPIRDYGLKNITELSYSNGMVFFAVLHELVGTGQFNDIIGSFYSKYAERGATLEEFRRHFIGESTVSLEKFFQDWLDTANFTSRLVGSGRFDEIVESYR